MLQSIRTHEAFQKTKHVQAWVHNFPKPLCHFFVSGKKLKNKIQSAVKPLATGFNI
jgi:hypothetical protein